jgi:spermidine synthase
MTLLAVASMIVPTILMGGTLPALAAAVRRWPKEHARSIGTLYATNTLGAVAGTVLAGFFFLPLWGDAVSLGIACGLNALGGVLSLAVGSRAPAEEPVTQVSQSAADRPSVALKEIRPPQYLVALFCGVAGLGLEIAWVRVLGMILGTTTYAFSTMLAVYLLMFSVGTLFSSRFLVPRSSARGILVFLLPITGLTSLATIPVFSRLPDLFLRMFPLFSDPWWKMTLAQSLLCGLVFVIPCFLMGTVFPLVLKWASPRKEHLGAVTGRLYAWNTAGSILGAVASGHFLIPILGLEKTIHICATVLLLLPASVLLAEPMRRRVRRLAGVAILVLAGILVLAAGPRWDRKSVADGVYFGARGKVKDPAYRLGDYRTLYYAEGLESTVEVRRSLQHGRIEIKINGKEVASTTYDDMRLQRFMGHLPFLLHGEAKTSVVIGLGAGVTFGSAVDHTGENTLCIEMEPKVIPAARIFGEANGFVVDRAGSQIVLADGRNFLKLTPKTFDVITSDPFHPIVKGSSRLYTRDFFRTSRARLNPGGVMAQYLPFYQLSPEDIRMIVRTFSDVFPHVSMWFTNIDTILIGSEEPLGIDYPALVKRLDREDFHNPLKPINLGHPHEFLASFVMADGLSEYVGGGVLNTDGHLRLEYSSAKRMYLDTVGSNIEEIARFKHSVLPYLTNVPESEESEIERWHQSRKLAMQARAWSRTDPARSVELAQEALEIVPEDRDTAHVLAQSCDRLGVAYLQALRFGDAEKVLREGVESIGDMDDMVRSVILAHLGGALISQGKIEEALEKSREAVTLNPDSAIALFNIGSVHLNRQEYEKAVYFYERALEKHPTMVPVLVNLSICYGRGKGDWDRAIEASARAVENDPSDTKAFYNYGLWQAAKAENLDPSRGEEARALRRGALRTWEKLMELEPDNERVKVLMDEVRSKME